MTDYSELVKALRCCATDNCCSCPYSIHEFRCATKMGEDAAAAIEALQAQLPKQGEWYTELFDGDKKYQCSNCLTHWDVETRYCPYCGVKMEVQE